MTLLLNNIKPYEGLDEIKLYSKLDEVKRYLDSQNIEYTSEVWKAEEETIPNPWTVLFIENSINLFFAGNDKLFKIYCTNNYEGSLPNSINLNTTLEEAIKIDNKLEYDDDGEDYESEDGYWIEDDLDTKKVMSITVFIKEMLENDKFDKLDW